MAAAQLYIPHQLIQDAAKHGELVVFVGAGASMLCGSPDWRGFANQVVAALEKGAVLTFLEAEQLRGLSDARRTLSIAIALAKESGIEIDFDAILHPGSPGAKGTELYGLLSSLRPVFVTTNYDKWLDEAGLTELATEVKVGGESEPAKGPRARPKYYLREHLSPALLTERGAVIHLHGSYVEPNSMVVSLKDYIEHYADSRVQAFLSAMFKSYTVLFVGYGLAELELLDYIVRSNESLKADRAEPRHFLLYPHRSTESVQTRFIEHFFRHQCGVYAIPYCIDTKGYQEVVEVFKVWSTQLDVREQSRLDLEASLDGFVSSADSESRNAALVLLGKKPELTSYFVNSLKDSVWFGDLDRAGFFSAEHSPELKVIESGNGTVYQADGWPALRYLEQIAASSEGAQASRIAEIVRAISSESQRRGRANWRTQWSLATILSQLPLEVITDADIEMVRTWLATGAETSMVGQELGEKLLPRLLDSANREDAGRAMSLVDALSMLRPAERSK